MHLACEHLDCLTRSTSMKSLASKMPCLVRLSVFIHSFIFILTNNAFIVAERLKQEGKQEIFQNETMEELEDEEGNVYNKKTYEDLKKQGLI